MRSSPKKKVYKKTQVAVSQWRKRKKRRRVRYLRESQQILLKAYKSKSSF